MLLALFAHKMIPAKRLVVIFRCLIALASMGLFAVLSESEDYHIEGFNGLGKETQPANALTATVFYYLLPAFR